ncbi:HYR domain-containing protein, partial [Oceanihabitans sp.]|nr:HYR domain-containing protein [Oceanihabitans sp.]
MAENDPGSCSSEVNWTAATVSDNCTGALISSNFNSGDTFPVGMTTVTYTSEDTAGNNAVSTSFIVTVNDTEAPTITCPSDINEIATSASGTVVNYTAPTGTDNCSATTALITTLYPSGATFPIGTTTVTYEVTDSAGLTANCSFTVTVTGVLPEIVCPANITVNNDAGACGANVSFEATDDVGIPASTISYSHVSGSEFPVGTTTVTATATNAVGSDSCTFTVTVNDTEDPVISCLPDITVNNTPGQCSADLNLAPPAISDNCGSIGNALDFDGVNDYVLIPRTIQDDFTIEFWFNSTQNAGSDGQWYGGYGMVDAEVGGVTTDFGVSLGAGKVLFGTGSTISPRDVTINSGVTLNDGTWHHVAATRTRTTGAMQLFIDGQLAASGTGGTQSLTAPNRIIIGRLQTNFREYDGKIDEVRIWDTVRTQTEIQANINNELDTEPGLVASYHFNEGVANSNNAGITTATDASGNGNNGTLYNFALSGLNSNWVGGNSVGGLTLTNNGPAAYPIGTTTVTWTATDAAGNTATCDQVVTVIDNAVPIAICNEITVQLDETGNYTLTQVDINALGAGSSSACGDGDVTFSVDLTSFSCDDIGSAGNSNEIAPTFVSQVAQNSRSIGAAYNPITEEFLFPNWASSTISRYDINRNLLGTYTYPHNGIFDLWVDGSDTGDYFSTDFYNLRIYRVDGSNNVVWNVPSSNGRVQAITTDAQYVYTHVPGQNYLGVYDKTTGAFVNNLTLGFNPGNIRSLIYANGKIYMGGIANSGSTLNSTWSAIHIINAADGAYISSFSTSIPSFYGLAFDGEVIWVHNGSQAAGYQIAEGSAYNTGNVVLTVTDSNGQTSTCNANVIVLDTVVPTISCPGDIEVDNDMGLCGAIVTYDVLSDDNCSASLIVEQTAGLPSGSLFEVGTTTNTFVVTDASGNTETCSFDVTVADTEAPVVACNEITIVLDGNGDVNLSASQLNMSSTDNCGGPLTFTIDGESSADFSCSDTGGDLDQLIISEYIDGAGANDCIEIYNGTGNPVVLTDNYSIAVYTDGSTTPTLWPLLGTIAVDNAYVVCQQFSSASGVDLTNGLTLTGNDAVALQDNGNAVDILGIIGNDPGTGWSAGTNQTNDRTLRRNDDVFAGNISNTNSGLASEWTSFPSADLSGLGAHDIETVGLSNNVILTVTDIYGNSSTCEAAVTVVDDTPPIAIAQDVVVQLDASGNGSTSGVLVNNGSSDVCGIASLVLDQNDFTCADVGNANPVILTVTDVNGNIATAPANVTVIDGVAPNAITQDAVVVLDANGNGSITVADINNGSNDACGVDTVTISPSTFNCSNVGNNEVTLTVTDVNGNVSTATANADVQDNTNPTAVCANITVTLDANGSWTITAADVDGGSEDACGIFSYAIDIDTFGCDDLGANDVVLTVTDNNGNESSCNAVVTVEGDLPVVDITEAVLPGLCQGD